jgi:hypothetical protein
MINGAIVALSVGRLFFGMDFIQAKKKKKNSEDVRKHRLQRPQSDTAGLTAEMQHSS